MNWKNWLVSIVSVSLVAACGGGGGDAGKSPFDAGGTKSASLSLELSKSAVLNSDIDGVTATVIAVDSKGKAVTDVAITYTVTGGIYTQANDKTDADGENIAVIKLGSNKANRTITIRATDGKNTAVAYLSVTGVKLSSTASSAIVSPGASSSVIFRLLDAQSTAMSGQKVEIVTSAGGEATGTTDSSGAYTYSFTAPATSGTLTVTGSAGGASVSQDVLVQSSGTTIPDSGSPSSKSMDINPTVVSVNAFGSNSNSVLIRTLFKGSSNNALANVRVKFDLDGDVNSIGGTFSVNNVYTDSNGYATTSYIPGAIPSPSNGVTVRACYSISGAPLDVVCGSGNQVKGTLTVTSQAVSVTLGADENVYTEVAGFYYRRFVVQVVDASGKAMPGVTITPQIDLVRYAKGNFEGSSYAIRNDYSCPNEDLNRNASLDASEDLDHSGFLAPRKADVAVAFDSLSSSGKTDSDGRLALKVTYPRSHASWVSYALNVSGSVDGSEGRTTLTEWAPYPATALTGAGAPAFVTSPYGVFYEDFTVPVDDNLPDGTPVTAGTVLKPCYNPY